MDCRHRSSCRITLQRPAIERYIIGFLRARRTDKRVGFLPVQTGPAVAEAVLARAGPTLEFDKSLHLPIDKAKN